MAMTRANLFAPALAVLLAGCGEGRSLPGETSTAADSAISRGFAGAGPAGDLTICAADGLAPVARRQAAAFMRMYRAAHLEVTPATARECASAIASGRAGAALIDRPLNEEERAVLRTNGVTFTEVAIGTGALAAIVAIDSPVRSLNAGAFQRLVAGGGVPWGELADSARGAVTGQARLALAPRNAGAVELLARAMLPAGALPRPAHAAATEADVIDWVATTPGGIGVVSLAALHADTTRRVRALALADSTGRPALPSQRAIADRLYPLRQPLVLVAVGGAGALTPAFATFARTTPGQEAVLRAGLLPAVRPVREIVLN